MDLSWMFEHLASREYPVCFVLINLTEVQWLRVAPNAHEIRKHPEIFLGRVE